MQKLTLQQGRRTCYESVYSGGTHPKQQVSLTQPEGKRAIYQLGPKNNKGNLFIYPVVGENKPVCLYISPPTLSRCISRQTKTQANPYSATLFSTGKLLQFNFH